MSLPDIPKNQIKSVNTITQREHEDAAAARRVVSVDKQGDFFGTLDNPIFVVSNADGGFTPHFVDVPDGTTTPGIEQILITDIVPEGTTRRVHQVLVSTWVPGYVVIEVDGSVVVSGRTGASKLNLVLSFDPIREVVGPASIVVKFTARASTPVAPVEAYLQASDK